MRFRRLLATPPDPTILLIRLSVGVVFLSEGVQKFLFPAELGAGRFAKIGLSANSSLSRYGMRCWYAVLLL